MSFDEKYKKEKCLWGIEPTQIVKSLLKYKKLGKVLDLGAGEGRNSIFLAEKGFDVTAIDISEIGINKLKNNPNVLRVYLPISGGTTPPINRENESFSTKENIWILPLIIIILVIVIILIVLLYLKKWKYK